MISASLTPTLPPPRQDPDLHIFSELLSYLVSNAATYGVAAATLISLALASLLFFTLFIFYYLGDSFYSRLPRRYPRPLRTLLACVYMALLLAMSLQALYWLSLTPR